MKLVKTLLMATLAAVVLCLGFVMVNGLRTAAAKTTMSDDAAEQIEKVVTRSLSRGSAYGQGSVSHDITGSAADEDVAPGAAGTIPHPPPPPPYQSPKPPKSPSVAVVPVESQSVEDTGTPTNQYSADTDAGGGEEPSTGLVAEAKKNFLVPDQHVGESIQEYVRRIRGGLVPGLVDSYEEKHLKTLQTNPVVDDLKQIRVPESPSPVGTVRETEERPDSQQKSPSTGDTVQDKVERQDSQQNLPSSDDNVDKQLEELTQQQQKQQEENNSPGE